MCLAQIRYYHEIFSRISFATILEIRNDFGERESFVGESSLLSQEWWSLANVKFYGFRSHTFASPLTSFHLVSRGLRISHFAQRLVALKWAVLNFVLQYVQTSKLRFSCLEKGRQETLLQVPDCRLFIIWRPINSHALFTLHNRERIERETCRHVWTLKWRSDLGKFWELKLI